jgi:Uma2 family endonuclease
MGIPPKKFITPEEYLEAERLSLEKHEYFEGEVFPLHREEVINGISAMSGASISHNEISSNCIFELKSKLKGKPCRTYGSDFRVNIPNNTLFTYPDISVFCNKIEVIDNEFDTAKNPTVIFEILSKSTRDYDLGGKFFLYRQIETLREYILIDSMKMHVQKYSKNDDDTWLLKDYFLNTDLLKIKSLEIEILLSDIYDNVKF